MSSNIQIPKICKNCLNEFVARTTVTKYCSPKCGKQANKKIRREGKLQTVREETERIKRLPIELLNSKQFLTISQTCELLSISRWTVSRAIKNNTLNAAKIGKRVLIRRIDLDKLFEQNEPNEQLPNELPKPKKYSIEECYCISEILQKYNISQTALQNLIKRNEIPKFPKGKFVYVPKVLIDNLLS